MPNFPDSIQGLPPCDELDMGIATESPWYYK